MVNVGLIGTGLLGSAIAKRLLSKGYRLTVYNRTRSKAEALEQYGAFVADTPMHVADESDIVITVLKDSYALEHIAFGINGLIYSKSKFVLADVSTINPFASKAIASRLKEHGIVMLDTLLWVVLNLLSKVCSYSWLEEARSIMRCLRMYSMQ